MNATSSLRLADMTFPRPRPTNRLTIARAAGVIVNSAGKECRKPIQIGNKNARNASVSKEGAHKRLGGNEPGGKPMRFSLIAGAAVLAAGLVTVALARDVPESGPAADG